MPIEKKGLRLLLRALSSRNYRLYFFGQAVSLIGTWMQQIAMRWLVYRLTGSELLLGVLGFVSDVPIFLLVPFAGVLADRFKRQRILVITQALAALQAAVLAVLAITHQATVWQVIALGGLLGIVNAFDVTARQAFIVDMVEEKQDLANAIALNSFIFNGAVLIGPSIAGVLIALVGEGPCFVVNSLSFLAVIGAILLMRIPERQMATTTLNIKRAILEGAGYAFRSVPIRSILWLVAVVSLVDASFSLIMPVFAEQILHGGPQAYGYLTSATGVGALIGAIFLASRQGISGLGKLIVAAGIMYGIGCFALSFSRFLGLSLSIVLVMGFSLMMQMASSNTIVQTIVEDEKRGRVLGLFVMARRGVMSLGSLVSGVVANSVGAPATLMIGGAACLAAVAGFAAKLALIRQTSHPFDIDAKDVKPRQGAER